MCTFLIIIKAISKQIRVDDLMLSKAQCVSMNRSPIESVSAEYAQSNDRFSCFVLLDKMYRFYIKHFQYPDVSDQ